jgi:serine/threonine protein kinase
VTIIRNNLKHPNIVRYLKTFKENDSLYIVMELIDGAPLSQHVRILKEKQQRWPEDKIWNLFIQTVLALKYLHRDKHIVHRDLTSNNIMLSENDKITITDFGLAKLKETNCSQMLSVVGTMFYSCPEIVKNEPYTDKADIWALGCVLYEICCLEPPFCTSNMLALATKITQSDYDETKLSVYSSLVATVVQHCLIVEPAKRPDVVGVAGLVAEKILTYTDSVRYKCNSLEKKLEKEKNRSQRMLAGQQEMRVDSYESQVSKASNETEQSDAGGFLLLPPTNAVTAGEARKSSESDVAVCGQKATSSQPVNIHAQVGVQLPGKIFRSVLKCCRYSQIWALYTLFVIRKFFKHDKSF